MARRIEADVLQRPGLRHGFFTREGGVSAGIYASLNGGTGSDDKRDHVMENRSKISKELEIPDRNLITPCQIHSPDVVVASTPWPVGEGPRADAIVTTAKNLAIGILTADCTPVLFADAEAHVIGVAHAGWRGALDGVLEATLAAMTALGASGNNTVAVIGPTISQQNYEVGDEFRDTFVKRDSQSERFFIEGPAIEGKTGRPHFDLPGYVAARLTDAGVGHVQNLGLCTYKDEARFFSYRRTTHRGEPDYGRQISAIVMS
ncbi:MAG: peptidoglycan editing factor PgeF [Fimbriimonadaceae bacterium]|nr:peptidoglycan editing factor PgeF [Alphaproteobacteria bacterium]